MLYIFWFFKAEWVAFSKLHFLLYKISLYTMKSIVYLTLYRLLSALSLSSVMV